MFSAVEDAIRQTNCQPVHRKRHLLRVPDVVGVATVRLGSLCLRILLLN